MVVLICLFVLLLFFFLIQKKISPFTQLLSFFLLLLPGTSSIYPGFSHLANAPGSTGTVVALETTPAGVMHLHVAWLGDSKAILSTGGGFTVELTEDHRATNPKVKKKIFY